MGSSSSSRLGACQVLAFFRAAIALRRASAALQRGDLAFIDEAPAGVIALRRRAGAERAYCVINLSGRGQRWQPALPGNTPPDRCLRVGDPSPRFDALGPWSGYLAVWSDA